MHFLRAIAVLAIFAISSNAHSSQVTNADLQKACAQRTIVTGYDENKKITQIGESIDGFCSGFIRASFESISTNQKCSSAGDNPEFLLSVYLHFLKERSLDANSSAYKALRDAFSRIPDCARPTGIN